MERFFPRDTNVAQGQQIVEILLCRLLSVARSPRVQFTYDMHALPVCSDMSTSAEYTQLIALSGHRRRAAAQLSVQRQRRTARRLASQQRQLEVAPQSGDKYVAIERHRMRRWIGEAVRSLPRKWELPSGVFVSGPGLPLPHTQRVAARGGFGGFARCAAPPATGSNSGPFRLIPLAAAAQPRLAPRSQAPLRASRRAPTASPRRPTSRASSPPPSAPRPTSAPPAAGAFAR